MIVLNYIIDTNLLKQQIIKLKTTQDNFGQVKYIIDQVITDLDFRPIINETNLIQFSRVCSNVQTVKQSLLTLMQRLGELIVCLERYSIELDEHQMETKHAIEYITDDLCVQIERSKRILSNGLYVDAYPKQSIYTTMKQSEKTVSVMETVNTDPLELIADSVEDF